MCQDQPLVVPLQSLPELRLHESKLPSDAPMSHELKLPRHVRLHDNKLPSASLHDISESITCLRTT